MNPDDPVQPPRPETERTRSARGYVSAVWLVPLLAVLVAAVVTWQNLRDRGVVIAIAFPDASGVEVGQTTLRYREVTVGLVEDVGFSSDLRQVNVYVRVNKDIAPFLDEDASFWIVQPEVTTRGVEGLNTILSGTYIEGTWDSEIGESQTVFRGDDRAPIVPPGVDGTAIVLRALDSSRLGPGAPILFRGIEVGEVADPRLSPDGSEIRVDAFVRAPYDRQLTTATRFWDSSGVSVSLGAGGVDLRIGSVASILEGGVTFDTLVSGGEPIRTGHVYNIFEDETDARAAAFAKPTQRAVQLGALFPAAISGLTDGAVVRYEGVRVGTVADITGFIRPDDPNREVQLLAILALQPGRMGLEGTFDDVQAIDYIDDLVRRGLRAQLVPTSLFGGDLAIELLDVEQPGTVPASGLEIGIADNPLVPTLPTEESGLAASAEGVLTRLSDLPIEELLASATDLLDNLNRIAADADTRAIPGAARAALEQGEGLLRDGRAIVSSPQTASVLADIEAIAADLRGISATIAERDVAASLADALDAGTEAAANVARGTRALDALSESAQAALDSANVLLRSEDTLALPGLARETLDGARQAVGGPEVAAILADTAAATAEIRALAEGLGGGALAARVETVLAGIDTAASNVAAGTADLGTLRQSIDGAVAAAETLLSSADTQALPGAARALLDDGGALIASPEVQSLIADLSATAADIRAITAQLVAQEAAARLTAALASAEQAAQSVAAGTESLPTLSDSANRVMAQAEVLAADLTRLSEKANALALDELVTATTDLMTTADAFLSSDEADDVPVVLSETLEELRLTIETIRTGGTLDNLNATLSSASGAADSIRLAADDLPALVNRLQTLSVNAGGVLSAYGEDSRINQELFAALRAATRAAEDVSSLSRTIERNPNSLLLGR